MINLLISHCIKTGTPPFGIKLSDEHCSEVKGPTQTQDRHRDLGFEIHTRRDQSGKAGIVKGRDGTHFQ